MTTEDGWETYWCYDCDQSFLYDPDPDPDVVYETPGCPFCGSTSTEAEDSSGNTCLNCDKPIPHGPYCSSTCEEMDNLPINKETQP